MADEARLKSYNEDVIQNHLLQAGGSKHEIEHLHVFSVI